ncbi:unnamed protein product, partial [Durusdinium trenchii]
SRGSTLRSAAKPLGKDTGGVRDGTILACRALILALIATCRGGWWVLEQPSTSCMEWLPCFQALLKLTSVRKYMTSMADFGGPTEERTILYSSSDAIEKLSQFHSRRNLRQRGMVRRYVDGSGKWRVQGGSQLKASQAYPAGFGRALASCRTLALKKQRRFARSFLKRAHESRGSLMDERPRANAKWVKGADLKPIITYLSQCQ